MYIPKNFGKNLINEFLGGKYMEENNLKNIVVLKNLPSNIVEEAIVVLKGNKIKLPEKVEKKQDASAKTKTKDYILKEAEMIVSNYISNIENKRYANKKIYNAIEKKYNRLKFISTVLIIALIAVAIF